MPLGLLRSITVLDLYNRLNFKANTERFYITLDSHFELFTYFYKMNLLSPCESMYGKVSVER